MELQGRGRRQRGPRIRGQSAKSLSLPFSLPRWAEALTPLLPDAPLMPADPSPRAWPRRQTPPSTPKQAFARRRRRISATTKGVACSNQHGHLPTRIARNQHPGATVTIQIRRDDRERAEGPRQGCPRPKAAVLPGDKDGHEVGIRRDQVRKAVALPGQHDDALAAGDHEVQPPGAIQIESLDRGGGRGVGVGSRPGRPVQRSMASARGVPMSTTLSNMSCVDYIVP